MTNPLTAVFLIIAYMPTELPNSLGIERAQIRDTQLLRLTFKTLGDRLAFPERAKAAIEAAGGEVIVCQEVANKYR